MLGQPDRYVEKFMSLMFTVFGRLELEARVGVL